MPLTKTARIFSLTGATAVAFLLPAYASDHVGYKGCRCNPTFEAFHSDTFGYYRTCWRAMGNPPCCPPTPKPADWSPPRPTPVPPEPTRAAPKETEKGSDKLPEPKLEEPANKPNPPKTGDTSKQK
jgi:hypothetical protein